MNKVLGNGLVAYIRKLRKVIEASTPPQLDSTAASGDSHEPVGDDIEAMEMFLDIMCE